MPVDENFANFIHNTSSLYQVMQKGSADLYRYKEGKIVQRQGFEYFGAMMGRLWAVITGNKQAYEHTQTQQLFEAALHGAFAIDYTHLTQINAKEINPEEYANCLAITDLFRNSHYDLKSFQKLDEAINKHSLPIILQDDDKGEELQSILDDKNFIKYSENILHQKFRRKKKTVTLQKIPSRCIEAYDSAVKVKQFFSQHTVLYHSHKVDIVLSMARHARIQSIRGNLHRISPKEDILLKIIEQNPDLAHAFMDYLNQAATTRKYYIKQFKSGKPLSKIQEYSNQLSKKLEKFYQVSNEDNRTTIKTKLELFDYCMDLMEHAMPHNQQVHTDNYFMGLETQDSKGVLDRALANYQEALQSEAAEKEKIEKSNLNQRQKDKRLEVLSYKHGHIARDRCGVLERSSWVNIQYNTNQGFVYGEREISFISQNGHKIAFSVPLDFRPLGDLNKRTIHNLHEFIQTHNEEINDILNQKNSIDNISLPANIEMDLLALNLTDEQERLFKSIALSFIYQINRNIELSTIHLGHKKIKNLQLPDEFKVDYLPLQGVLHTEPNIHSVTEKPVEKAFPTPKPQVSKGKSFSVTKLLSDRLGKVTQSISNVYANYRKTRFQKRVIHAQLIHHLLYADDNQNIFSIDPRHNAFSALVERIHNDHAEMDITLIRDELYKLIRERETENHIESHKLNQLIFGAQAEIITDAIHNPDEDQFRIFVTQLLADDPRTGIYPDYHVTSKEYEQNCGITKKSDQTVQYTKISWEKEQIFRHRRRMTSVVQSLIKALHTLDSKTAQEKGKIIGQIINSDPQFRDYKPVIKDFNTYIKL